VAAISFGAELSRVEPSLGADSAQTRRRPPPPEKARRIISPRVVTYKPTWFLHFANPNLGFTKCRNQVGLYVTTRSGHNARALVSYVTRAVAVAVVVAS